jgi:hypothetical protein
MKIRSDLIRVRDWADERIQGGEEPPWAWYQYMKLIETVDAILAGMDGPTTRQIERRGNLIQLRASGCPQDSAQPYFLDPTPRMPA